MYSIILSMSVLKYFGTHAKFATELIKMHVQYMGFPVKFKFVFAKAISDRMEHCYQLKLATW